MFINVLMWGWVSGSGWGQVSGVGWGSCVGELGWTDANNDL